jgi:hypothetical protein
VPGAQWWERKAAKLIAREWPEIKNAWLGYIPTIDPPGSVPESSIGELPTLHSQVSRMSPRDPMSVSEEIVGLREGVFIEGLFLLHKAANVIACAQVDVAKGLRSWSLSSAYQAAFFAMKAILHFLGVAVAEVQSKSILIDVWSPPERRRRGIPTPEFNMLLQNCHRFEHRQMWAVFQRMLRVTSERGSILSNENATSLIELAVNDFAAQRNSLHYRVAWPFDDLHRCSVVPDFGAHAGGITDGTALNDPDREDFSIVLGIVLLRMGYGMLYEIAQEAPALKAELEILREWLRNDCHALYRRACAIE